jgi:hypothetical protein
MHFFASGACLVCQNIVKTWSRGLDQAPMDESPVTPKTTGLRVI